MARSAGGTTRLLMVFLLILSCTALLLGIWLVESVPSRAAQVFGPPAPHLGLMQRWNLSLRLLLAEKALTWPADPNGVERQFTVALGEAVDSVAFRMEDEGLIRSSEAFRTFLIYAGLDTGLQAGEYQLSPAWSAVELAYRLQDATPAQISFVVLAGWRAEEIAAALPTSGLTIAPDVFLRAVKRPAQVNLPEVLQGVKRLEGFLYPGTYELERDTDVNGLLALLTAEFAAQTDADWRAAVEARGLTLEEAVTLASIIEREAVVDEEAPLIASVFHNRLQAGMRLESDPTVQYALGWQESAQTWWKNPLTLDDLRVDSLYNTYRNTGLPPGPICNPGSSALQAAAYPAESPYYYFRARCDGSGRHAFAVTFDEHLQNACP